jgi:RNA polymerase sigma-70 factor (sigma-E family)
VSPLDDVEFAAFMRGRYSAMLRTATFLMGDRQLGEDLLQAALFKTAERWRRLRDTGAAEAYTRVVMVRLAGDAHRRRWRGERPSAALPENSAADAIGAVDLADALYRELARLPYEQRAVLVLRYFEDRTEREVAQLLECSIGTVKSRASRGLQQLRSRGILTGAPEPAAGS